MLYGVWVVTETDEVHVVLSPRLRQIFDVPLISLSGAMLLCVFGSLVLSMAIVVVQLRIESARILREPRESKHPSRELCAVSCVFGFLSRP